MEAVLHILHLDADARIPAHPFHFPADAGKPEQAIRLSIERERDRHDLWLTAARAGKPGERDAGEDLAALRGGEFVYQHGR